jgi:oligoribonuclease NrnB/cAMP/cGMP phosphodiesterase (DHH superfamily)
VWGEDGRYIPRGHDDPLDVRPNECEEVVFVDIAPNNHHLRALGEVAERIVVLDHHLSARDHYTADSAVENLVEEGGHYIHFDLGHSGAVLAWRHFHPDEPVPDLLRYVEDQDLWIWQLQSSAAVNAAIGSYAREFPVWSELAERPWQQLAAEGEPILRAQRIEVERTLRSSHPVAIGSRRVEAVNAPHHRSGAAFGHPVGLVYRVTGAQVDVSIYSIGDVDVSAIASEFGGGGHLNAAGFSVSLRSWLERFV